MDRVPERLTVTVNEAAALLGISRAKAYECVHAGDIPALRLGRRMVIPMKVISTLLDLSTDLTESRDG